jgi:hypothetical protein
MYFLKLGKFWDIWNPEWDFWDAGAELFKSHETGTVPGNQNGWYMCGADDIIAAYSPVMLLGPVIQILSCM